MLLIAIINVVVVDHDPTVTADANQKASNAQEIRYTYVMTS